MENHTQYRQAIAKLGDRIVTREKLMTAALHESLTSIRLFDAAAGWHLEGARTCAQWLSWRLGLGASTARERVRVARALGVFKQIDAALGNGEISYSKARAITRVATVETEALLLQIARYSSGAQLERFCAQFRRDPNASPPPVRFVRRRPIASAGMVRIEIQLEPEQAETVWEALMQSASAHATTTADGPAITDVADAIHRFAVRALSEAAHREPAAEAVAQSTECVSRNPVPTEQRSTESADCAVAPSVECCGPSTGFASAQPDVTRATQPTDETATLPSAGGTGGSDRQPAVAAPAPARAVDATSDTGEPIDQTRASPRPTTTFDPTSARG